MAHPDHDFGQVEVTVNVGDTKAPKKWFPLEYQGKEGEEAWQQIVRDAEFHGYDSVSNFLTSIEGVGVLRNINTARDQALGHALAQGFSPDQIEIDIKDGALSYRLKDAPAADADITYTHFTDNAGNVWGYDKEKGPGQYDTKTGKYSGVHLLAGVASSEVIEGTDDRSGIEDPRDFGLGSGRGDFYYLGNGQYRHVPDVDEPFQIDTKEGAGDVVDMPSMGGQLIRTSPNQYQFVRQSFVSDDPSKTVKTDDYGRQYQQQIDGSWKELAPRYEADVIEKGGRDFLQQTTGALSELAPRFDPALQDVDGMSLLQQRSGAINQLTKPTMDQIITQALVDGEYDKAFAFQDFQDRPTANEAFQTALAFARSPADQVLISAIARGEQTVQPPPADTIQRVGPQADFLVDAYRDFQRRTQAGRAPTEEQIATGLARSAAGDTPLTDTLRSQLDALEQKMAFDAEEHNIKMDALRSKNVQAEEMYNLQRDAQIRKLFPDTGATGGPSETSTQNGGAAPGPDSVAGDPKDNQVAGDPKDNQVEIDPRYRLWKEAGYESPEDMAADIARQNALIGTGQVYRGDTSTGAGDNGTEEVGTEGDDTEGVGTVSTVLPQEGQDFLQGLPRPSVPTSQPSAPAPAAPIHVNPTFADIPAQSAPPGRYSDPWVSPAQASAAAAKSAEAARPRGTAGIRSLGPEGLDFLKSRAGGGTVGNKELTVVGEDGPEIAMFPAGTHILPLGRATKQDIRSAQATGRAYQSGGIVFGELPFGIRQLQSGRPITPSRGYLSRAAGLTLPSAQAFQNLTPESRDVYFDLAQQAGIPSRAFGQELQTTMPRGARLPTSRMLPLGRQGVR